MGLFDDRVSMKGCVCKRFLSCVLATVLAVSLAPIPAQGLEEAEEGGPFPNHALANEPSSEHPESGAPLSESGGSADDVDQNDSSAKKEESVESDSGPSAVENEPHDSLPLIEDEDADVSTVDPGPIDPSIEGLEGYLEAELAEGFGFYALNGGDEEAEGIVASADPYQEASSKLDAWIKANLTSDLSPYQKMVKACKYAGGLTYDSNYSSWEDLMLYGKGTCWSGAYFMQEVGKRIGVDCRFRNADRSPAAAAPTHRDAVARFSNGSYVVFDATPEFGFYWEENPPYITRDHTIRQYDGFATSVVVPSVIGGTTMTALEDEAFMRSSIATLIKEITIPSTITSIGDSCFAGLTSCVAYKVDAANPAYKSIDGVLYTKDGKTLVAYPQGRENTLFSVPSGVASIAPGALANSRHLTSVTLPSTVRSIGRSAFQDCRSLSSINIPSGVTSIEEQAFMKCASLASVSFPSSVKTINPNAFAMTGMKKVVLPKTVERVGDGAFTIMLSEWGGGGIDEAYVYNPRMEFDGTPFFMCMVYGYAGSTAEAYANRSHLSFKDIASAGTPSTVWNRLSGDIALDTMAAITEQGFYAGSCDNVILATMDGYWDALTASALAGLKECPILLTDGRYLSWQTYDQIRRLGVKTVYIAGGTSAVSGAVEDQLRSNSLNTKRLAGATAIDTALKIYEQGKGSWGKTAVIATSATFQDALSASPLAYAKAAPVFLTNSSTKKLDAKVRSAILAGGFTEVLICGGTAAISNEVEKQLSGVSCVRKGGATCYETSSAIATYCISKGMSKSTVGVATGDSYYDALAGSALCGKQNATLVLVSDGNRSAIDSFIKANKASISSGFVFGGAAAVSSSTYDALRRAVP